MQFSNASEVDAVCWTMRYASWKRGRNRARINELFNGAPPYTPEEVQENGVQVNVNDLSSTRLAHDARAQFYSAFCKPGNYTKATTDWGPVHKRDIWSTIVTKEWNRPMKRSLEYFEKYRSTIAQDILHGIGPSAWRDRDCWCPDPIGIEDVLVPANTLLTMRNLPFFAIHRSLTVPELKRMTRNAPANVDNYNGWNMDLVNSCIEWIDRESVSLMGTTYPEIWSPEKTQERVKSDGGIYVGDNVPTIEVFDFYFWNDDAKVEGWNRRMILDVWATPQEASGGMVRKAGDVFNRNKMEFLFNSKNRKFANNRSELITFQFADLSSVAPFRYHSVRSLGFLLFAICHLQNRLRCKFNEAVFESLMMYFEVNSQDDAQRALKINLINRGFIDSSVKFIKAADRFQVQAALAELGLSENQRLIETNTSSYTQNRPTDQGGKEKPTATQVMAEVNAMNSLIQASLLQAYKYAEQEDLEVFRRFCKVNSTDPDVRTFQANCTKQGVPLKFLTPEAWEIEHERVMGAGNKTLEMAITQQLMEWYDRLDPEPQRTVLRKGILAVSDDAAFALDLVPESPVKVTDSVHDAQLAAGTLMQGLPVAVKTGMNHIEYVETLLASMAILIKKAEQPSTITPTYINGLANMAAHVSAHIEIIAQDPNEQQRVKIYGDQLGKMMNAVKSMSQQLQKAMASQNGNGQGPDPEAMQKLQAQQAMAQAKVDNTRESHAQKTAQRQLQFEQGMKQDEAQAQLDLQRKAADAQLDLHRKSVETAIDLERERIKTDMKHEQAKAKPKPKQK